LTGSASQSEKTVTSIFTRGRIQTASIAAAVLVAWLYIDGGAYAQTPGSQPTPAPSPTPQTEPGGGEKAKLPANKTSSKHEKDEAAPSSQSASEEEKSELPKGWLNIKTGKREDTQAVARSVEDAYNQYQKTCLEGTEEQKSAAKKKWRDLKLFLEKFAINDEAQKLKEVSQAFDGREHYYKILERLEKNPNSGASEIAKAKSDFSKARDKWEKLSLKAGKKILAEIKAEIIYGGPESCPAPSETTPPPEEKKKKKHKGETSGPLDFFGNVTIGVGVGEHGHKATRHSHEKDDADKKSDEENGETGHDNISHEPSGRDENEQHEPSGHDDKNKSHDHHDDGKTSSPPM